MHQDFPFHSICIYFFFFLGYSILQIFVTKSIINFKEFLISIYKILFLEFLENQKLLDIFPINKYSLSPFPILSQEESSFQYFHSLELIRMKNLVQALQTKS